MNRTYTSDKHRWESNVTFSVEQLSMTVPRFSLVFDFASSSTHSSQYNSCTIAEAVDTVGLDNRYLQQ